VGIGESEPAELSGAIEQAVGSDKPTVIDVRTNIEGIAPKAWDA